MATEIDEHMLLDESPIVNTTSPLNPRPNIDDDTTDLGFDYSKILVKSNPNTPAQSPATIQGIPSWTYQSIEQEIKLKLEQLGMSLNTMAKLHHNREFMEMAIARNLPPRGMQLDLNCTLLNKTQTVEEQWDQILQKASNDLVKLAHDHYTNQVEVELKHQKILLKETKELTNHHNLTKAENTNLTGLAKRTMDKHQSETANLAAQLAAKRNGRNKRQKTQQTDNQSPPPPQQARTHRRQNPKNGRPGPHRGPNTKTLLQKKRPALKLRKKHKKHTHNRKRPHHRIYNHTQSNTQSHNICNLSNTHLSTHEISVLSKGLSFIPKPKKTNPLELYSDILSFVRKSNITLHFSWQTKKGQTTFRTKIQVQPRRNTK